MPRSASKPNCYIVAGSNGAGKTTFAREFLPHYAQCSNFINPDLIARALSPFDPEAALVRAGRMVLERIGEATQSRTDFAFETTLSGRSYASLIRGIRASGYRIHLFYLWIPDAELALARIRARVAKGGHNVPSQDVRRRFGRTLTNLFALYRPLLDTLHFFDNSQRTPRLVFKEEAGKTTVFDADLFSLIQSMAIQ
jgi:predicted ABC-type ATPase